MFAPKFCCCNQFSRFSQRLLLLLFNLFLTISSIVLTFESLAEETISAASDLQNKTVVKDNTPDNSSNTTVQSSKKSTPKETAVTNNTDKNSTASENKNDAEATVDAAQTLKKIRNSYAKKMGFDKLHDDLILSQSSAYIFLNRKKVRDVSNNILDYWYLSPNEDDFNLTFIVFEAISINPLVINLDPDIDAQLPLKKNGNSLMNYSEAPRTLTTFINFPIPESAMTYVNENSEETNSESGSSYLPDMFSTTNYFVLTLAFLGFSILGYIIYRIIVWAFMLDQNLEYDLKKGRDEEVVAPVDMNVYKDYFYQITPEDKH